jgi:hypothetical protein
MASFFLRSLARQTKNCVLKKHHNLVLWQLPSHPVLRQSIHHRFHSHMESAQVQNFPATELNSVLKRTSVHRVVPQSQNLALTAEQNLLMGKHPR